MKLTKRIIKGGKKASKRRTKTKSKTIKRKNKRFSRYGGEIHRTLACQQETDRIEELSNKLKRRENQIRSALRQMREIERREGERRERERIISELRENELFQHVE